MDSAPVGFSRPTRNVGALATDSEGVSPIGRTTGRRVGGAGREPQHDHHDRHDLYGGCRGAFAFGQIHLGAWVLGLTAVSDVLDGLVARRSHRVTAFGAFYDSTLDRIADGAVLAGLTLFWATPGTRHSIAMVVVCLLAMLGSFLTSYTRARAEGLGVDVTVGWMQRPERIVLLAAPQAFFGLAFDGAVLKFIVLLLTLASWITVAQRVAYVRRATVASNR